MTLTFSHIEFLIFVGLIFLTIIFTPEIRKFLFGIGKAIFPKQKTNAANQPNAISSQIQKEVVHEIAIAIKNLSKEKIGGLIVVSKNTELDSILETGISLEAKISTQLIESIFSKESPLHDGAIIIDHGKIVAASCVLPLSHSSELPKLIGLRHRAAIGTSEKYDVSVFVISEESGEIAFSSDGSLKQNLNKNEVVELLLKHLK